jgi:hypothetical protein
MADVFEYPMRVRYMEVDAQGVVFNAWYLAFFDEAMTAFLAARGASYPTLAAAGVDVQLVHVEVDWSAGLRYADLCRRRHKSAYAEVRVMPTGLLDGLPGGRVSVEGGGITRWSWRGYRLSRNASRVSGGR